MNSQTAAEDGKRLLLRLEMFAADEWKATPAQLGKEIGEYIARSIKANEALLEANERLQAQCDRLTGMKFSDRMHAALVSRAETAEAERAEARGQIEKAQAKIDALMLEYCPDEMKTEQFDNWASHQRRATPEEEAAIAAIVAAQRGEPSK